jgi:NTP pyrophosphatase (non-canonical NTP hydrolase)
MEFKEIIKRAREIQDAYKVFSAKNGHKVWGASEYTQGLVGDLGELTKLIMAKNNLRDVEDIDKRLSHELSDCLWSVIVISEELGIDLEKEFLLTMDDLEKRTK